MSPSMPPASSPTRSQSPSGRLYFVGPDRHRSKFSRPERRDHRHIERVAASSNQHPTDSPRVLAGIECPPAVAQPDLHPGGEIHRLRYRRNVDVGQVAEHVASGDAHRSAEGYREVREISTDSGAIVEDVEGGRQRVARAVLELEVVVDPVAERLHARPDWLGLAEELPGRGHHHVREAIPAWEGEVQQLAGDLLDQSLAE